MFPAISERGGICTHAHSAAATLAFRVHGYLSPCLYASLSGSPSPALALYLPSCFSALPRRDVALVFEPPHMSRHVPSSDALRTRARSSSSRPQTRMWRLHCTFPSPCSLLTVASPPRERNREVWQWKTLRTQREQSEIYASVQNPRKNFAACNSPPGIKVLPLPGGSRAAPM